MNELWKLLVVGGVVLIVAGLFIKFFGKLPGDIIVKRENMTVYFPIVTCIVLSIILSVIFSIIGKFKG
ncbi:MAG TPA: DUF2905 domain-containing protein [Firmicutes bacterium]|nr:DUF2905 domain-containing protein [Bacillales bacterium]HJA40157.1 DUF2905 domain-containing protein [Bacillota bacterium]